MNRIERIQADLAREGDAYRAHFVADDVRALLRLVKAMRTDHIAFVGQNEAVDEAAASIAALEAPCDTN